MSNNDYALEFINTLKGGSYVQYKSSVNRFIEYLNNDDILNISPQQVINFTLESKANLSYINTFLLFVYGKYSDMGNLEMIKYLLPTNYKGLIKL